MTVKYTNDVRTTLTSGITNTATTLYVASAANLPSVSGANEHTYLTLSNATDTAKEIVKCTTISGTTLTVVRGQESTTALAFSAGENVQLRITAGLLDEAITDSAYTHPNHSGDVVSAADGAMTIQTDAVDIAMLSASGTAGSTTFLRGDNTWATAGSTSASDLTSGTLADARFPATLPAISGANLTNLPSGGGIGSFIGTSIAVSNDDTALENDDGSSNNNIGIGTRAGRQLITGSNNVAIGEEALRNATSAGNIAVGWNSLWRNTSGAYNVALGIRALSGGATYTGSYNVGVGYEAGKGITTGQYNVLSGYQAGYSLTSGSYNVLNGYKAGSTLSNGSNSIAIGREALMSTNPSGYSNIGIGMQVGTSLTGGYHNILIGYSAGNSITTGWDNCIVGYQAGTYLTTGAFNTFLGQDSGYFHVSGSKNVAIGHQSRPSSSSVSNEITLGSSTITRFRIPGIGVDWTSATIPAGTTLTTKGDLESFTTVRARLPVGSNAQVLTADSTAASGLAWAAAAGGGAEYYEQTTAPTGKSDGTFWLDTADEVLYQQQTSNWVQVSTAAMPGGSTLTTKGDLESFTTTQARLPVGTNAQVLTADSTAASGVAWATPSGGGPTLFAENPAVGATTPLATGPSSLAIGDGASNVVGATHGVAIGTNASTLYDSSVAIGRDVSGGYHSVAIGYDAQAVSNMGVAIGRQSDAGYGSVGIGYTANGSGNFSAALGYKAISAGVESVALGDARAGGTNSFSVCINNNATNYGATASQSTAIGINAKATGPYAIAIGWGAQAGNRSMTLGGYNSISGDNAVCVGTWNSNIAQPYSIGIGGGYADDRELRNTWVYGNMTAGALGRSQGRKLVHYIETTDATEIALRTNGTSASRSNQLTLDDEMVLTFLGTVTAKQSASDNVGAWKVFGVARRRTGVATTTLVDYTIETMINPTGWVLSISADTTLGTIAFKVTGVAATNIRWTSNIDTSEVMN